MDGHRPGATVERKSSASTRSLDDNSSAESTKKASTKLSSNEFRLKRPWHSWQRAVPFLVRLLVVFSLSVGMVLGVRGQVFDIRPTSMFGGLDPDIQLAFVGALNTIILLFAQASLEESSLVALTLRMTGDIPRGANLLDFELKNEVTRPWLALLNSWKRLSRRGSRWGILWQMLWKFATSVSFLLLALSVNTIAIPKLRWHPDYRLGQTSKEILSTSVFSWQGLDWPDFRAQGQRSVGNGTAMEPMANALIAANVTSQLPLLREVYSKRHSGWRGIDSISLTVTGINTAIRPDSHVRTMSVRKAAIKSIFHEGRATGPYYAKYALAFFGNFNITVPMLDTFCVAGQQRGVAPGSFSVSPANLPASPALTVSLGALKSLKFEGASCNMVISQALFPVQASYSTGVNVTYLDRVNVTLNNYGDDFDIQTTPLPGIFDPRIPEILGKQVTSVLERLDSLVQGMNAIELLVLQARNLRSAEDGLRSDTAALAPVIGALSQRLISIADWDMITLHSPTDPGVNWTTTHRNVRWQVYGSGPRLLWEWAIAPVVFIMILAHFYGLMQSLRHGIVAGPWCETGGMLIAANKAPTLQTVNDSCEIGDICAQSNLKEARFYLAEVESGSGELREIKSGATNGLSKYESYSYKKRRGSV